MTAPDVRTAAQAEADKLYPQLTELENPAICKSRRLRQKAFIKGAVWGAALVTPTREQIAEVIAYSMPGWNEDTEDGALTGHWERVNAECLRHGRIYADAVLALLRSPS